MLADIAQIEALLAASEIRIACQPFP